MMRYILAQAIKSSDLNLPKTDITDGTFASVWRLVFGIAGAVALLSITYGALKYVMSQGDSSQLAKAKDTILYSVVGLVICLAAIAIVTFVLGRL